MSGFIYLPQAQISALAQDQITASEVTGEISDATALKIVIQDVGIAEQYRVQKKRPQAWSNADNLYAANVVAKPWPGTDIPMSNLSMPVVLEAVEKIMPVIFAAFFSDKTPFILSPTGKTTPEVARAKSGLLRWAIKTSGFKEGVRQCLKCWLLYGVGVAKWGWKTSEVKKRSYHVDPATKKVARKPEDATEVSHPTFENVELPKVLFDSSLREQDCRKGKFVVGQYFIFASDLDELRSDPAYKNIPTLDQLAAILADKGEPAVDSLNSSKLQTTRDLQAAPETAVSSSNPLEQPLEILEYVTEDYFFCVLQRMIVIRNSRNDLDKVNYLSASFIDVPGSAHGFGIAKLLSGEQKFQVGVQNAWINQLTLQLNPSYQLKKGIGQGTQNIKLSPGKIVNESGELVPLATVSVTQEAMGAIQSSELRADRRVGANSADSMPTQALRTSAGVQAFNSSTVDRLQYEIEIFSDLVFIPALEAFLEICKDKLQPDEINAILSEQDGKAYEGDTLDIYNGTCNIEVLASTKLAARRAAAQLVPLIMQLVSASPVQESLISQKKKFNYAEFIEQTVELAGWDVDQLIQEATDEDVQRFMQMQPGAQKSSADANNLAVTHQYALEEIEANGEARAGVQVVRHLLTESGKSDIAPTPETLKG
jgi:hypothetical protein